MSTNAQDNRKKSLRLKENGTSDADWRRLLADQVEEHGTSATARALGYSPAVVSQTMKGKYAGRTDKVRARVLEVFGAREVDCPVLGTIALRRCGKIRRADFRATNPVQVRLWRTCPICPNNPGYDPDD